MSASVCVSGTQPTGTISPRVCLSDIRPRCGMELPGEVHAGAGPSRGLWPARSGYSVRPPARPRSQKAGGGGGRWVPGSDSGPAWE